MAGLLKQKISETFRPHFVHSLSPTVMSKKNYPKSRTVSSMAEQQLVELPVEGSTPSPSATLTEYEATVVSIPKRNFRLLVCRLDDGRLVNVQVQKNLNYRPGMDLKVVCEVVGPMELWRSVGRDPRFKGRW